MSAHTHHQLPVTVSSSRRARALRSSVVLLAALALGLQLCACRSDEPDEPASAAEEGEHTDRTAGETDDDTPETVAYPTPPPAEQGAVAPLEPDAAPPASERLETPEGLAELPNKIVSHRDWTAGSPTYIQVDKPLYLPGETIWYRYWQVDDHSLSNQWAQPTVELVGPRGTVLKSHRVRRQDGNVVANAFDLPAAAAGGEYVLRVRNGRQETERTIKVARFEPPRFKKSLEFERKAYGPGDTVSASVEVKRSSGEPIADTVLRGDVRLDGDSIGPVEARTNAAGEATVKFDLPDEIAEGDGVLTVIVREGGPDDEDGGLAESISRRIPIALRDLEVEFFPEGGDLVEGLASRVYFEVRTPLDEPADIEGLVVDDEGRPVTKVRSHHFGLGRFELTPEPGRSYELRVTRPAGIEGAYPLPTAEGAGCVLRTWDDPDSVVHAIRVSVRCTDKQPVTIVGMLRDRIYDIATVEAGPDTQGVAHLTTDDEVLRRAQGLARVTVFDSDENPLAERLVFRNRRGGVQVQIEPDRSSYQPGESVSLTVRTRDTRGEPLEADIALSVVDDTVVSLADDKHEGHILSELLLMGGANALAGEIDEPKFFFELDEPKAALALELLVGVRGWRTFEWRPVLEASSDAAGLLGQGDTMESLLGTGMTAQGFDATAWEGIAMSGEGTGFGLGIQGTGRGGGGFGVGNFGTAGRGGGGKGGRAYGKGTGKLGKSAPDTNTGEVGGVTGDDAVLVPRAGLRALDEIEEAEEEILEGKPTTEPVLRPARPDVQGALDKRIVRRVVRQRRREAKACYESALEKNPGVTGTVKVRWKIGADGRVEAVTVDDDDIGNAALSTCLVERVGGWRFPAPKGGGTVAVEYPFRFETRVRQVHPGAVEFAPVRVFPVPDTDEAAAGAQREDIRQTVYWNPSVRTDESGEATVEFPLSDAVTSFRVFAEGSAGFGVVGRTEHVIRADLPFSVDVKLPVEVTAGDHVEVPIVLTNERPQPMTASLQLSLGPLTKAGTPSEDLSAIELAASGTRTVYLPLDIQPGRGLNAIAIEASAGEVRDRFERELRVVPRGFPAEARDSGTLSDTSTATLDVESPVPGSVRATLRLQPSPAAMMQSSVESMLREPSGCFEQTSSATYPNIMVLEFLDRSGLGKPRTRKRAQGMIRRGYERLVGYEVEGGGFEWFGKPPAHEALTAYGVLEFSDMKRVMPEAVDAAMLRRTVEWLLERRDGSGGYQLSSKRVDRFGGASRDVTEAYITWALVESGEVEPSTLSTELDALERVAGNTDDPYLLALTVLALEADKTRSALTPARRLAGMQDERGAWPDAETSITSSGGRNLEIETTALSAMALLRVDADTYDQQLASAATWLSSQSDGLGGYGSTQATVLALRALVDIWLRDEGASELAGMDVLIDGEVVAQPTWVAGQSDPVDVELSAALADGGEHEIELRTASGEGTAMPWGVLAQYHAVGGVDGADARVDIVTELEDDDASLELGETVRLTATIENATDEHLAMSVARIAIPGGTELQLWQLEELKEHGVVDFYETGPRELVAYFRHLEPGEKKTIPVELASTVPGRYTAPASQAYVYYDDDHRAWADGYELEITTP